MDSQSFVQAIIASAYDTAVSGTLKSLQSPAGRHPQGELLKLAAWLEALTPAQRTSARMAIAKACEQATYNVLLVLDGLLAAEDSREKGRLELAYIRGDERTELNPSGGQPLSSLFKQLLESRDRA